MPAADYSTLDPEVVRAVEALSVQLAAKVAAQARAVAAARKRDLDSITDKKLRESASR